MTVFRAARFANWLHNGRPVGPQGPETTEDGAYTLTPEALASNSWTRNPGATYFLPSLDEWFKAAFYKGGGQDSGYWMYPTRNDIAPTFSFPPGDDNSAVANWQFSIQGAYGVGSYPDSFGPYGTYDQAGNLVEWTETISNIDGDYRYGHGGSYQTGLSELSELSSDGAGQYHALALPERDGEYGYYRAAGFRIAAIPEPNSLGMMIVGAVAVLAGRHIRLSVTFALQANR